MDFAALKRELREVVRDDSTEIERNIPVYVNTAISLIVEEANLPGFKSFLSVTTDTELAYVSLPTTSSWKVTYAGTADGELSVITLEELISQYPALDETGDLKYVVVEGSLLY